jgi:predicted branched-subunit amino acid permease
MRSVTDQNVEHAMTAELRVNEALLRSSRRRLMFDMLGIAVSAGGFGLVYGLAARGVGLSTLEVGAMSALVFSGGAQFAALAYIADGAPWIAVILLTAFINARHLLYGAALAPYLTDKPIALKAAMAHVLNDETFAISLSHFRRLGRADIHGYWLGAFGGTVVPWIGGSILGATLAGNIPEPARFGLDVIFPAAMAGLAVGLITGRREVAAALTGAAVGVIAGLAIDPSAGIVAGGVIGPIVGLLVPTNEASPK